MGQSSAGRIGAARSSHSAVVLAALLLIAAIAGAWDASASGSSADLIAFIERIANPPQKFADDEALKAYLDPV